MHGTGRINSNEVVENEKLIVKYEIAKNFSQHFSETVGKLWNVKQKILKISWLI